MDDLARQAAGNLSTFSGAHTFTAARAAKTAAFLAAATPVHMRLALLLDVSTTIQWLVVYRQQVVVVTRPFVASDDLGQPIFLASLGDDLAHATPVSLLDEITLGGVVVLVTQDDHIALGLPGCVAIPGMLDPPPLADGSPSAEQAGIDRLHFDASGGTGDAPVFGVLPTVFPLALGETPVLQALSTPFPTTGNHSSAARVWYKAMQHLAAHNGGFSLHDHPGLFAASDLPATSFPTSILVASSGVAVTTVDAMSPHFGHVQTVHREAGHGALLSHTAGLPAPASGAPGAPGPLQPGPDFATVITAAITPLVNTIAAGNQANMASTTQSERESQQDQKAVEARYKITFAHVVKVTDPVDGSVTETVEFPTLSPAFLAVLSPTKVTKAEESYQESMANHMRSKARSTSYFDGMTNWDAKSFGIPGISCIRRFRWAVEPPILDPDEVKDKLGFVHFAASDPGSVVYKTRQEEGRLLTRQHLVDEDKSKLKRKITDLHHHGLIATGHDLQTAIANIWTFCSWAFTDFVTDPPAIWIALEELVFLLNTREGRVWTGQHKGLPHVFLHLFISAQHMLGPFIALGNTLEYRQAVLAGDPVAVAAYTAASKFALLQVHKVNNIIHQGDLGAFREAPSIMGIFHQNTPESSPAKRSPPSAVSDDSTAVSDLSSPVPRKGKKPADSRSPASQPNDSSHDLVARKAEGVMKHSAHGKPPVPVSLFSHPKSGKMTYLCGNASTVGYACPRTKDECNFIHVHKPYDLKRAVDRDTLKAFITSHVDLSFARPGTS
jgi:hypothetical protein